MNKDIIDQQKEMLTMARRHMIGMLNAIEKSLLVLEPKCRECYNKFGWLNKCDCNKK